MFFIVEALLRVLYNKIQHKGWGRVETRHMLADLDISSVQSSMVVFEALLEKYFTGAHRWVNFTLITQPKSSSYYVSQDEQFSLIF